MGDVNVLVLEEDSSLVAELQSELRARGFVVTAMRDGAAGLARAVSQPFDVIVVSAELPGMNGFRVCNRIKKDPVAKRVPLLLTGAIASELDAHRQLASRADAYFEKPLRIDEIVARIRAVTDGARPARESSIVVELEDVLSEPPPGPVGKPEDRAKMQALLDELEGARKEVATLAAARERLAEHEATIERLTRELADARSEVVQHDSLAKEVERLRKEVVAARQATQEERAQGQRRLEEANKRLEARRVDVERIHQELIAEKKARAADAAAHERTIAAERVGREKDRLDARQALQSLADAKDRARNQELTRQREEHDVRIKNLVRELEETRSKKPSSDAEAKLAALQTEHEWEVSALTALLEQERAEAAAARRAAEDARRAARDEARPAIVAEVQAQADARIEALERKVREIDAALARTRENLDAERRDRLVEEVEQQERVDALEATIAAKEELATRLGKELEAARAEVAQLETEIVGLRNELVAARVASDQLDRNRELLDRARELLAEFAKRET